MPSFGNSQCPFFLFAVIERGLLDFVPVKICELGNLRLLWNWKKLKLSWLCTNVGFCVFVFRSSVCNCSLASSACPIVILVFVVPFTEEWKNYYFRVPLILSIKNHSAHSVRYLSNRYKGAVVEDSEYVLIFLIRKSNRQMSLFLLSVVDLQTPRSRKETEKKQKDGLSWICKCFLRL
jgi:hypothetical protein